MSTALGHLRRNLVAYVAIFLALGGGYALAGTTTGQTITACASKKTGALFLHHRGRCPRGESKVRWNQQGPAGPVGATGATGATGAAGAQGPAPDTYAVEVLGTTVSPADAPVTVTHPATGQYVVTANTNCATTPQSINVPTVSPTAPPSGSNYPVAWATASGPRSIGVYTGMVNGGAFTPTDLAFSLTDVCAS